jgi:GAF domain-containing protein
MLKRIFRYFSPPTIEDPEIDTRARTLHRILLSFLGLTILFLFYAVVYPPRAQIIVAIVAIVFELGLLSALHNGRVTLASTVFTFFLWVAITSSVILYGGIRDTGFMAYLAVLVIAGSTLGGRSTLAYAGLTIAMAVLLALLENSGMLPAYQTVSLVSVIISHSITLLAAALILDLSIRGTSQIARRALTSENDQREINSRLEQAQKELTKYTADLERNNTAFQTIAQLSRASQGIFSEEELLALSVNTIAEQLKLEIVNIYLLSSEKDAAFLSYSNRPEIGGLIGNRQSLVVEVSDSPFRILSGKTIRIQIGEKYYFISSPPPILDASESIVLPLVSGIDFIGLLNVQGGPELGGQELKELLQPIVESIADRISLKRTIRGMEDRVLDARRTGGLGIDAWDTIDRLGNIGFRYDQIGVFPSEEELPEGIADAIARGEAQIYTTESEPVRSRLIAPISSRGEVIGVIGYEQDREHVWPEEERTLLETIASRVSLALENTRLVAEAQKRAERERKIGQTASRMRETLDIDVVLQTAVREIRRALDIEQAEIRISPALQSESQLSRSHENK